MPEETDAALIEQTFSTENNAIDALRGKFDNDKLRALQSIGAFIGNGQSLREACILSHVDPDHFETLIRIDKDVAKFITFKETVYKAKLMRTVTQNATDRNSEKSAGWLLERKFREEFNSKPLDASSSRPQDLLEEGIAFVRQHGDSTPIVSPALSGGSVRDVEAMEVPNHQ